MTNLYTKRIPFLVSMFGDNWSKFYFENSSDQEHIWNYQTKRDISIIRKYTINGNPLKGKING